MKVGDYVRTKKEGIGKIIKIEPFMNDIHIFLDSKKGNITFQSKDGVFKVNNEQNIIKSSPNIIDLIEVGDYVNGSKIIELATNIDGKILYLETDITEFDNVYACGNINIYEKDIKSIVTKECFESVEYKIGE